MCSWVFSHRRLWWLLRERLPSRVRAWVRASVLAGLTATAALAAATARVSGSVRSHRGQGRRGCAAVRRRWEVDVDDRRVVGWSRPLLELPSLSMKLTISYGTMAYATPGRRRHTVVEEELMGAGGWRARRVYAPAPSKEETDAEAEAEGEGDEIPRAIYASLHLPSTSAGSPARDVEITGAVNARIGSCAEGQLDMTELVAAIRAHRSGSVRSMRRSDPMDALLASGKEEEHDVRLLIVLSDLREFVFAPGDPISFRDGGKPTE